MGYCRFLESLLGEGRAMVPAPCPMLAAEREAGDAILARYERIWRRGLPEPVPRFDPTAAGWAAVWLFHACQIAVYRDVDEGAIHEALGGAFPHPLTAEACYSVDLTFRFLGDLEKFARSAADQDPLVSALRAQAVLWPLSGVGMAGIGDVSIDAFAQHPGLMQLYADRVLAAGDTSRMGDARARRQIESSLGIFPELAPRFAAEDGSGSRQGQTP